MSEQTEQWIFHLFGKIYIVAQPSKQEIDDEDRRQLFQACLMLDQYHGLPEQLQAAFEQLIQIQTAPLFYAGMAFFVITSAYIQSNTYDKEGLEAAYNWLKQAQAIAPQEKGVLLASFDYYLAKEEYKLSQEVLQKGKTLFPKSFEFYKRQILFLTRQGTVRQIEKTFSEIRKLKLSNERKVALLEMEARAYVSRKRWSQAIKCYKQLLKTQPNNPWFWHNLSIAQFETKNGFSAFYSNRRALSLMDFGAARNMEKLIRPIFLIQFGAIVVMILIFLSAWPR